MKMFDLYDRNGFWIAAVLENHPLDAQKAYELLMRKWFMWAEHAERIIERKPGAKCARST